jgi:hypothetical protein
LETHRFALHRKEMRVEVQEVRQTMELVAEEVLALLALMEPQPRAVMVAQA